MYDPVYDFPICKGAMPSQMPSVVDVYDVAASIGKDFEMLIDQYGPDAVTRLMPKVINVLEELEDYALRCETESRQLYTLQAAVQKLETEKVARVEDRSRYEKELEQIEETWSAESQDLLKMVEKLQEENRRLLSQLNENSTDTCTKAREDNVSVQELQLISRLKDTINEQRKTIREYKKEMAQKSVGMEALQLQTDHLARQNAELNRKHCVSKKKASHLVDEKSDLEVELQAKEQVIRQMRLLVHSDSSEPPTPGVTSSPPLSPFNSAEQQNFVDRLNAEGKMIVSNEECDRPRFSLHELKEVLLERNELKTKLIEVEEELKIFKKAGDDEEPVQGPINREPDEKLRPRIEEDLEIGIKRFFQKLLDRLN